MKKVYKKKREVLTKALKNHFKDKVNIIGDSTGLHLIANFSGINFTDEVLNEIRSHKAVVYPVELHTVEKGHYNNFIILGYGNLNEKQIEEGVTRISRALKPLIADT
jgi:GntR family transcriptional regulator/MocR family aminotransferase